MRARMDTTIVKPRQHGSTLLLVLAILSVLVLVAAGLAYTSRIEGAASANFAQATQARIAASTGLPYSVTLLRSISSEPVSPLQAWQKAPEALQQASRQSAVSGRATGSGSDTAALYSRALGDAGLGSEATKAVEAAGIPPASVTVTDLSGMVNVNAIRSDRALGRVLQAALSGQTKAQSASADARARAVLSLRSNGAGKGDRRASGSEQPSAERLDPRFGAPTDGSRRFQNLNELAQRTHGGPAAIFSSDEVESLRKVLTVFSQAPEVYHRDDGTSVPKLSLSELTPEQTLTVLRMAFPDKDDQLLRQFAANVADALDDDRIPTRFGGEENSASEDTVFGVEPGLPFVTEVYPDAKTPEDGEDRGQFVEIHNPWPKPLLLAGWRLEASGGSPVPLNIVIPSGGFVVVTDNYESPDENAAPETGSLLSIFGTRADGSQRKVVEETGLSLADRDSSVRLFDEQNHLVDVFTWNSGAATDSTKSYQRDDPRVRASNVADATPFERPRTGTGAGRQEMTGAFDEPKSFAPDQDGRSRDTAAGEAGETSGTWLRCPVDLLLVSTAYASAGTDSMSGQAKVVIHSWQRPEREIAEEGKSTNLDSRIIDLFTTLRPSGSEAVAASPAEKEERVASRRNRSAPGQNGSAATAHTGSRMAGGPGARTQGRPAAAMNPAGLSASSRGRNTVASAGTRADRAAAEARISAFRHGQTLSGVGAAGLGVPAPGSETLNSARAESSDATVSLPLLYSYGRLNLNTASRIALHALDGEVSGHDYLPPKRLDEIERYRTDRLREGKAPFTNLSDLLVQLFPKPTDGELRAFAKLLEQVTVDSSSFEITAENRVAGSADPKRRTARAKVRWTIALDRDPYSLIDYVELH